MRKWIIVCGATHVAEVMSVNMVALGIHIPKQDMVAIIWRITI